MKFKLLTLSLFLVICFSVLGCKEQNDKNIEILNAKLEKNKKETQQLLKNCDNCQMTSVEKPILPEGSPTDLSLSIDYKNEKSYQPFQYDILNGYGIVGKLKMTGRKVEDIQFDLFEAGDCKRYFVKKATYEGHNKEYDTHKIKFEVAKYNKPGDRPDAHLDFGGKDFKIKPGQILNVQIVSTDYPELNAPPEKFKDEDILYDSDYAIRIFPPFICQGKFTSGNGN